MGGIRVGWRLTGLGGGAQVRLRYSGLYNHISSGVYCSDNFDVYSLDVGTGLRRPSMESPMRVAHDSASVVPPDQQWLAWVLVLFLVRVRGRVRLFFC